jgi:photosystem II stability/assembly factor-like uncharacterized protein
MGTGLDGELFLGTADGHVFASKDRVNSWELRGRVGSRLDAVVTRLVSNGQQLLASVWYQQGGGGGIFQSSDAGRTWKSVGLEQEAVRALEVAPSQPQILIAGTLTGVFRSDDSGKNWTRISPLGDQELRNIDSIAIDVRDPGTIYAGTFHLPWKTTDGGKNWQPITAGVIDDSDVMSMHVDPTNPERLYMSACSGIYRSDNRGAQWTKMQGIPYSARRTQAIVQDPVNPQVLFAGTTEGLWMTRDAGESWTRTTSKDWIVNSVVVLADKGGDHDRVVLGTEGQGVQVSDDAGVRFVSANNGFTHTLVRQLVAQRDHPENLLAIVQRAGWELIESHDSGEKWEPMPLTTVLRGKTSKMTTHEVQGIYSSPWGWLVRLEHGELLIFEERRREWREWRPRLFEERAATRSRRTATATRAATRRKESPVTIRGFSDEAAYLSARDGLFRCAESGACAGLHAYARGEATAAWISSSGKDMSVIRNGKLGISGDAGETAAWRELPVPAAQVTSIDVNGSGVDRQMFLCTTRGLFVSTAGVQEWKKLGLGLPPFQIDQWLRASGVWVATERNGSVYVSRNEGASWQRADQDADRGRFTGLVAVRDSVVLGSSQSEGLLELTVTGNAQ